MSARIIAPLCVMIATSVGHAALNAYEPFNYSSLANGTSTTALGFSGAWTCGTAPAIAAGLTYSNLSVANSSFSSTGGRQSVAFASPLATGTKWISFLFNQAGDNGGNYCGVYFPNGGTGLFFGYGFAPATASTGALRPGSILTTGNTVANATSLASSFTGTYGATPYFVALKIDFDTSGANDTVTIYLNPQANSAAPGVTASYTFSSFDVGTISGIGFQRPGGAFAIKADEIRVGDSYADVSGSGSSNGVTAVAPLITSVTPASGWTNGGALVTVAGSNFLSGATVKFGVNFAPVSSLTFNSLAVTVPSGIPGAVNVVVVNTNGLSATNVNGFIYLVPPPAPIVIAARSVTMSGSNLKLVWHGGTNTTSVLLTATNVASGGNWTPLTTNMFGPDGLSTNSLPINLAEPKRFFGLGAPADIVVVLAPASLHTIASGSTNAIGLAWTASLSPGVTGYRILYGTSSDALTNSIDVGNVTSANIAGLIPGQTYFLAVIALVPGGQSLAADALITAQTDTTVGIVPLFNSSTPLEAPVSVTTSNALITYLADRARDRHAREADFHIYDHYLSWYWEQRVANIEIIDHIGKGGTDIVFHYTTQAALNPAEFRTFFRGINTVAEYHNNQTATLVSTNASDTPGETDFHYTATINANAQDRKSVV